MRVCGLLRGVCLCCWCATGFTVTMPLPKSQLGSSTVHIDNVNVTFQCACSNPARAWLGFVFLLDSKIGQSLSISIQPVCNFIERK